MKIVVIGGGASGTSFCTRARRLSEKAKITVFEKGDYVAYSNCSLPYRLSRRVDNINDLIMHTPESFKQTFNIDVFIKHEVVGVDNEKKEVQVLNHETGETFKESYDKLVISMGTPAIKPGIPGIDGAKNVFSLKTPNDIRNILDYMADHVVKHATIIGGGFIGIEIAENLIDEGIKVTVIDAEKQLLPRTTDPDFAAHLHKKMIESGVQLITQDKVVEIKNSGKLVVLESNREIKTNLIFMTIGTYVEAKIFKDLGIKFGETRGIVVDNHQQTSETDILAIGDIAESIDLKGKPTRIGLAAPAARQATVAANTIFNYKINNISDTYAGSQGTNAVTFRGLTIASIGLTEKQLKAKDIKYHKTVNARPNMVGAFKKSSKQIFLKVLYDEKMKILGAQAVGPTSTEKRISYIALAMMAEIPYHKLADFQIAYAATLDTHFDVVNVGAKIAMHIKNKDFKQVFVENVDYPLRDENYKFLDVRSKKEYDAGHIENAINIPLQELRERYWELDKSKKYVVNCGSGLRSYNAIMILKHLGFEHAYNLAGGYKHFEAFKKYSVVV